VLDPPFPEELHAAASTAPTVGTRP
jgi:hypothetical protein